MVRPILLSLSHVSTNAATDRLCEQVEKNPWWKNVKGPFPEQYSCVGVKPDGGGSMRGRGLVGKMNIHRAVNNHDLKAIVDAVEGGEDANEVEAVRTRDLPPLSPRAVAKKCCWVVQEPQYGSAAFRAVQHPLG